MASADFSQIKIPGYKILNKLGEGAMAQVYLAMQEALDRKIALKIMAEALLADPEYSERFLREAKIVAQLSHPHIISVYDVGVFDACHYLAMEYHGGGDLKQKIRRGLTQDESIRIVMQIASALDFAHREGYVHRDVKPENILFDRNGFAILTDFGIARSGESTAKMTAVGTIMGTPKYMSPEQASGLEVDGRSDIYSLGVIFYELLTGEAPYLADNPIAICHMHTANPIPELPTRFAQFQPLITRTMAKSAKDRLATGGEMIKLLDSLVADSDSSHAAKTEILDGYTTDVTSVLGVGDIEHTAVLSQTAGINTSTINESAAGSVTAKPAKPRVMMAIVSFIVVAGLGLGLLYVQKQGGIHYFDLTTKNKNSDRAGNVKVAPAIAPALEVSEEQPVTDSSVAESTVDSNAEKLTEAKIRTQSTPLITSVKLMSPQSMSLCSTKQPYMLGRRIINSNDSLTQGECFSIQVEVAREVDLIAYSHAENGTIYRLIPNDCNAMGLGNRRFQSGEAVSFPLDKDNNLTVIGLDDNPGKEWIYVIAVVDKKMRQSVLDSLEAVPDVCAGAKGGNIAVKPVQDLMERLSTKNAGRMQWLVSSFNHKVL